MSGSGSQASRKSILEVRSMAGRVLAPPAAPGGSGTGQAAHGFLLFFGGMCFFLILVFRYPPFGAVGVSPCRLFAWFWCRGCLRLAVCFLAYYLDLLLLGTGMEIHGQPVLSRFRPVLPVVPKPALPCSGLPKLISVTLDCRGFKWYSLL
ncbi:hypothetical protein C807_01296 [Lachnospiraceae bacterium 28-4]|nr:hypothetical protein C807_01296 [Lachnospiraceae bacterium 28-4]